MNKKERAKWAAWAEQPKSLAERWAVWAAMTAETEEWSIKSAGTTPAMSELVIWAALDGNIQHLARRLRKGLASRKELAFVADLLEEKAASRRPRRGQPRRFTNEQIATAVFQFREAYPGWQEKKIKGEVADLFGVKYRHVYNVLKALDPKRRKRHKQSARYLVGKLGYSTRKIARK